MGTRPRSPRSGRRGQGVLVALLMALAGTAAAAADRSPPAPLAALEEEFATTLADLVRRCRRGGEDRLATLVAEWPLPAAGARQQIVAVPDGWTTPDWLAGPVATGLWDDFRAARRQRAAGYFALAVEAARAHAALPTRAEAAQGERPAWADRGAAAVHLLHLALRDDPDHEQARRVGGWVRRGERWVSQEVDRRLDRGDDYDPAFGWLPRGRLDRYRAGERYDLGRWVDAATFAGRPRSLERPVRYDSDHWRITSTTNLEDTAALAAALEETCLVWRQAFGGYQAEPATRERLFEGRGRAALTETFAATLVEDRAEYVRALTAIEPAAARTDGMYWSPTKTAWFMADDDRRTGDADATRTVRHEATHQLFAETRPTSRMAGERVGFWAIEAAACYMESLETAPYGWTLGGPDAGRMPAARQRVLEDGFQVPLEELAALGRREFQADERLPQIYSQISGLADFFMNGQQGRYRDAFVEYLVRVYTGSAAADTLEKLCRRSHADLDEEFRRHLATAESAAAAAPAGVR